MLSWEGGRQVKAWEKWEGWHGDTMASSKFEKTQHAKVDFPKEVADAIEKQTPTYARILAWRDGFEASILSVRSRAGGSSAKRSRSTPRSTSRRRRWGGGSRPRRGRPRGYAASWIDVAAAGRVDT
mmetsp:Transcript_14720/g.45620  ORF Transcript_14720/g.45620 Transcript_14720/m.45620 type:complete len:126 (-) Transcript_14720:484-861(-)